MVIPYGRQSISESDIAAVGDVLRSDFLTQGPIVPKFENALGQRCGTRFAVAMNSATSALHLGCLALGVGQGDIVWTSPISFIASANCAKYCGADVDFVDIESNTYNMSPQALEKKLIAAQRDGNLPKVVIPVHIAGQSCDMAGIHSLSQRFGFSIIEDASHAVGSTYRGKPTGSCEFSDITVFSFHPVKIITTGEGGMALTNDPELAKSMFRLRSHGITRDAGEMQQEPDGPWYYEQLELGFNFRMTDIAAGLGINQLQRIDEFVSRRNEIAESYDSIFANTAVKAPTRSPDTYSAFHLYIVRVIFSDYGTTQNRVFENLHANQILANLHYIPIYRQPYYRQFGYSRESFPESEKYYSEAISLPMYPGLSAADQEFVAETLLSALGDQPRN